MSHHPADLIDTWQGRSVLIIGDAMLDCYLTGYANRLCQEAPVPVVAVTQCQDFPGGAANVAANVTSLGGKASLLSVMGQDHTGDRLRAVLATHSIATDHVLITTTRQTLAKQRVMADAHLIVRFDQGSTDSLLQALEIQLIQQLTTLFPTADAVIVSDYGYGVLTPAIIQTLANLQQQYPRPLLIDAKQLKQYQTVGATVIKPNYTEVINLLALPKQTTQRVDQIMPHGAHLLRLTGANIAAVTLDAEGVLVFENGQPPFHIPTTPVPTNQTSGAGDTFISTLALALATQTSVAIATTVATAATNLVVTQIGTTTCQHAELKQLLAGQFAAISPATVLSLTPHSSYV